MTLEAALGIMIFGAACVGYAVGIITTLWAIGEPDDRPPDPPHTGWRRPK